MASDNRFGHLNEVDSGSSPSLPRPTQQRRPTLVRSAVSSCTSLPLADSGMAVTIQLEDVNPARYENGRSLSCTSRATEPLLHQFKDDIKVPQTSIRQIDEDDSTDATLVVSPPASPFGTTLSYQTCYLFGGDRWKVLTCLCLFFLHGLAEASTGALMSSMMDNFSVTESRLSRIFVAQCFGFGISPLFTQRLQSQLGLMATLIYSEWVMFLAFLVLSLHSSFEVFVSAFGFLGFGMAINFTLINVFTANLPNPTLVTSLVHGSYGLGAIVSPLIVKPISKNTHWRRFYILAVGITSLCVCATIASFRGHDTTQCTTPDAHGSPVAASSRRQWAYWRHRIFFDRKVFSAATILGTFFSFFYQGTEASLAGWMSSFLLSQPKAYRNDDDVGYVLTGFWVGITVGRFVFSLLGPRIGERRTVVILGLLAAGFETVVWQLKNFVGRSVALGCVGFVLGPISPFATVAFIRAIDSPVQTTSVAIMASLGSVGGALLPFVVGQAFKWHGQWIMHPLSLAFIGGMLLMWSLFLRI